MGNTDSVNVGSEYAWLLRMIRTGNNNGVRMALQRVPQELTFEQRERVITTALLGFDPYGTLMILQDEPRFAWHVQQRLQSLAKLTDRLKAPSDQTES